ncbi:MAG: FTR1 family iron permease, partial [Candidatus Helarchaeota archaeon]
MLNYVNIFVPTFIAFREGLEASLVIVILLLYLKKSDRKKYNKFVYLGLFLGIVLSLLFALFFTLMFGGFSGFSEKIFEGITFMISGVLIITLIMWLSKEGSKLKINLEEKVDSAINSSKSLSITFLTLIMILREGIELILMLSGTISIGGASQLDIFLGTLMGLVISIIIGLLVFYGMKTFNISKFFKITNIILILFAAGLITYGIHEFIEAGIINPIISEVWNIKQILPESFPDGNPLTPEWLEIIGSLLKTLFGYNANPSLVEILVYPLILITIIIISK